MNIHDNICKPYERDGKSIATSATHNIWIVLRRRLKPTEHVRRKMKGTRGSSVRCERVK